MYWDVCVLLFFTGTFTPLRKKKLSSLPSDLPGRQVSLHALRAAPSERAQMVAQAPVSQPLPDIPPYISGRCRHLPQLERSAVEGGRESVQASFCVAKACPSYWNAYCTSAWNGYGSRG